MRKWVSGALIVSILAAPVHANDFGGFMASSGGQILSLTEKAMQAFNNKDGNFQCTQPEPTQPEPTPPPTLLGFENVCKADNQPPKMPSEKKQFCEAAKVNLESANANSQLTAVWGGVGVVCLAACVAGYTVPGANAYTTHACAGAQAVGFVWDVAVTKDFATALVGVGAVVGGYTVNNSIKKEPANPPAEDKGDAGSCLMAAGAVLNAFIKNHKRAQSFSNYEEYVTCAERMGGNKEGLLHEGQDNGTSFSQTSVQSNSRLNANANGLKLPDSGGNLGAPTGESGLFNPVTQANQARALCNSRNSTDGVLSCALAASSAKDPLPSGVRSPVFKKLMQNELLPLSDYLNGNNSLSGSMKNALDQPGFGLSPQAKQAASAAIDYAEKAASSIDGSEGSVYSGGGGGSQGGLGGPNVGAMGDLMQNMLGSLMGGKKGEEKNRLPQGMNFGKKDSNPYETAFNDVHTSLFERVSNKYFTVNGRVSSSALKK